MNIHYTHRFNARGSLLCHDMLLEAMLLNRLTRFEKFVLSRFPRLAKYLRIKLCVHYNHWGKTTQIVRGKKVLYAITQTRLENKV